MGIVECMKENIEKYMEQVGISPWQVYPSDMEQFANLLLAEYAEEYRKLCAGESVVVPRDRDHAEAMVRVGMFYLENSK